MTAYFIRRLLLVIPTFIGITIMVFTITRFVPGGPIERIISETRALQAGHGGSASGMSRGSGQPLSEEQIAKLKAYYGFDKPLLTSYFIWLSKVVRGDLGISTRYQDPVWGMIREKIPVSLYFGILSLFMIYGICIPLGMAKAVRHRTGFDNISSILIFTGYAIPGWVAGIFMLVLFSSHYDIFPLGGLVSE